MSKKRTIDEPIAYCGLPLIKERVFDRNVGEERERMILLHAKKWTNGTKLRYYFYKGNATDGSPSSWKPRAGSLDIVKKAFKTWMDIGIGLVFEETSDREEAEIRIGFDSSDGAWSYVGRDVIDLIQNKNKKNRTMNLGWDDLDTAMHEIGHTIGFPHEHQNPKAGLVWDEEAVYAALAAPPNNWDRDKTFYNIIRKIEPDVVQGSEHDGDSVMHYPFNAGMIKAPAKYKNGLHPAGGLSARDKEWIKTFYPPLKKADFQELSEAVSAALNIAPGEQKNFVIKPKRTKKFTISTFGDMDTVMVLSLKDGDQETYLSGDDDSGEDYNSKIQLKLTKGKEYLVKVRLYYKDKDGVGAIMYW